MRLRTRHMDAEFLLERVGIHKVGAMRMAEALDHNRRRAVLEGDGHHLAERRRIVEST